MLWKKKNIISRLIDLIFWLRNPTQTYFLLYFERVSCASGGIWGSNPRENKQSQRNCQATHYLWIEGRSHIANLLFVGSKPYRPYSQRYRPSRFAWLHGAKRPFPETQRRASFILIPPNHWLANHMVLWVEAWWPLISRWPLSQAATWNGYPLRYSKVLHIYVCCINCAKAVCTQDWLGVYCRLDQPDHQVTLN